MTTKVKSLFKGLRYISQIFDEKDEDIQIGFPTDVKHVAHIGWDGPSANMPSWMNEFRSPTDVKSGPLESLGQLSPKGISGSPPRADLRRHHSSDLGPASNSTRKRGGMDGAKHGTTRRHHSEKEAALGSLNSSGSSRHTRRPQKSNLGPQTESSTLDLPSIPKSSRRKKGSTSEGGSTKSSRSSRSLRSKSGHDSLSEIQFSEIETTNEPRKEFQSN